MKTQLISIYGMQQTQLSGSVQQAASGAQLGICPESSGSLLIPEHSGKPLPGLGNP